MKRATDKQNKWIPKDFVVDIELGVCYSHAERLAMVVPGLRYVEGHARFYQAEGWDEHAWCEAPDGTIVDPYFKAKFPHSWKKIEYRKPKDEANNKWLDNNIQFPRLIAEADYAGAFSSYMVEKIASEMDLNIVQVHELIDRAIAEFVRIKSDLPTYVREKSKNKRRSKKSV